MKILEKIDIHDFIKNAWSYENIVNLFVQTRGDSILYKACLTVNWQTNESIIVLPELDKHLSLQEIEEVYSIYEQTEQHTIFQGNILKLADGSEISFFHTPDHYENVYADLTALKNTNFFKDMSVKWNNIHIQFIKGYGIQLNDYKIPCYNYWNKDGHYSSDICITIKRPNGKIEQKLHFNCFENDIKN